MVGSMINGAKHSGTRRAANGRPLDLDSPFRPPLDMDVVERARLLDVERISAAGFRVGGGEDEHHVALLPYFECHCGDFLYRSRICKHLVAALISVGDPEACHKAAVAERRASRREE